MNKEDTKQAILGFTEFFKDITDNKNLKIPDDIAKEYDIDQSDSSIEALKQKSCEVLEYDKDHIWYKGKQYISLQRFLEVKAEMSDIDNNKYDEFGFFNPFSVNEEKSENDTSQLGTEIDFIQPKKIVGKLISINVLNKIRYEVLEYIDDLDIAAEICDIFDKYESEIENT